MCRRAYRLGSTKATVSDIFVFRVRIMLAVFIGTFVEARIGRVIVLTSAVVVIDIAVSVMTFSS